MPKSLRNQPSSEDQRNLIIATVLFAVIMFGWTFWFGPQPPGQQAAQDTTAQQAEAPTAEADSVPAPGTTPDTAGAPGAQGADAQTAGTPPADAASTSPGADDQEPGRPPSDPTIASAMEGEDRTIIVESDLYEAVLSTKGGTIKKFTLKEYKHFDQTTPVSIVDSTAHGALGVSFMTPSSRLVDSRDFYFTASTDQDTIRIGEEPETLSFETQIGEGSLRQTYTFQPDSYDVGLDVSQQNAASYATADGYDLIWDGGVPLTEGGTEAELTSSGVFAYSGGEMESVLVEDEEHDEKTLNGSISWLAVKNKYFTAVMMPDEPSNVRGADIIGDRKAGTNGSVGSKALTARLRMPAASDRDESDSFHMYLGPIYYDALAKYERDLYDMVDYGWDFFEWMTRPMAKWFFIPILTYMGGFLPYGVVVIFLAVFVKMLVYPLTKKSYRSMAQMRELQPEMERIKEEYGDDPQKQQEEMMKLYRETGVNPLGGCLPMLFQYPIIIALYQFIPQSIQLRQESFLWAADLSAPDKILQLPFEIPFLGDYLAGFTLLMGLSMVVTMRLQSTPTSAGGQAKLLMYGMPVFIFFIFNRFASALSLYYLFYNVVTAAQQKWINHQLEKEDDIDLENRGDGSTNGESKGFFARLMEKAEEAHKQR